MVDVFEVSSDAGSETGDVEVISDSSDDVEFLGHWAPGLSGEKPYEERRLQQTVGQPAGRGAPGFPD